MGFVFDKSEFLMKRDIQTASWKVKLAQPITEMDYLIYEIMTFTEALPIDEQRKIHRFIAKRAVACGWLQNKLEFKHNATMILEK